jgi:tellurite resistance protein
MSADSITVTPQGRYLEYLPIASFGAVMGLTGLSIAWRLAQSRYGAPHWVAEWIGYIAILTFGLVSVGYGTKFVTAADAVRAEFRHPIAGNLFGTFLISLLLLPIILAPLVLTVARVVWMAGATGMTLFAWVIVSRWMSDRQLVAHATPAWIVPVVGLLDMPLALPYLDLPSLHGMMMFGLSVGLFFAIPLFTLIFSRLVFEPPMPEALQPSLLILLAPFAVGFSTYVATTGRVDLFAESLYLLTLFMLAILIGRLRQLGRCCPFRISWWAIGFPLAAASVAATQFAEAEPGWTTDILALTLLSLATVVIVAMLLRTLLDVGRGELRRLSG